MLSERKKLLALLSKRQQLEQELEHNNSSSNSSNNNNINNSATTKTQLDEMIPALVNFFKCTDPADLAQKYPTTADMQAAAEKQRYFASRKINPSPKMAQVYEQLRENGTDADYLEFVRMTKTTFVSIVSSVLKQNPLYKSQSGGQETIEKQMAVTLWRMGHHGKDAGIGDASKIFGLSEGSIMKCTQRCMGALNGIAVDVVRWPSRGEKQAIKNRIKELGKQPSTTFGNNDTNEASPEDESIDDAIGILTNMKVVLHSRPIMANPNEYLVPVPPRLLHAAAEWFASSGKKRWTSIPIAESSLLAGSDLQDLGLERATPTPVDAPRQRKRRKAATKRASKMASNQGAGQDSIGNDVDAEVDPSTDAGSRKRKPRKSRCQSQRFILGEGETRSDPAAIGTPTNISVIKSGGYVRRDYGYNVLMVCDSTTRVRLVETMTPASWNDQQSLEASSIHNMGTTYFDDGEYLVADGTFDLGDTILPVTPVSTRPESIAFSASATPGATATADGDVEVIMKEEDLDMFEIDAAELEEMEAQKQLYESLARIHKRSQDCERMLKARFPSLLGVRVQIKDDQVGHDNVKSWIMACATIHNLVLADDTSFDPEWETQLDHWEALYRAHQDNLARYIWKANNKPHRKPARKSAPNNPIRGSEDPSLGGSNDAEAELETEVGTETEMETEDNNSIRAGSSLPTTPAEVSDSSAPANHPSIPPFVYGDELAREFNSQLVETGSFSHNQALGEADFAETLNRLSESIKASNQARADVQTLHQVRQQQLMGQMELQPQHTSDHLLPSTSSLEEDQDNAGHSLSMLLN
ncbi:hypothetical protein BGX24_009764 [Mortierella sp. AD032]|nr:hypothetical protein BGX24_009764 [Mortierella sp. AD032]